MKTDMQLRDDVLDELRWEPSINEKAIGVEVKEGVVTLAGFVDNYAQKYAAERAAERVTGVRALADDVVVRLPSSATRTDTDIAAAALKALDWDVEVPNEAVKVKAENGWIWLEGKLEWQYQKTSAERAVRNLMGVKGVSNMIRLVPKHVSTTEVSKNIRDALRRTAEFEADRITVEALDGKVTLRGAVKSFAEREDAERAAWSAPGVTTVEDRIVVGI
jgi:osmotically-inducible protein OsmY